MTSTKTRADVMPGQAEMRNRKRHVINPFEKTEPRAKQEPILQISPALGNGCNEPSVHLIMKKEPRASVDNADTTTDDSNPPEADLYTPVSSNSNSTVNNGDRNEDVLNQVPKDSSRNINAEPKMLFRVSKDQAAELLCRFERPAKSAKPAPGSERTRVPRTALSFEDKLKIIDELESSVHHNFAQTGRHYGVSRSQISRIWKYKTILRKDAKTFGLHCRKRKYPFKEEDVDTALKAWFDKEIQQHSRISGPMLKAKAEQLATDMGRDFSPSGGWLSRFKQRHGISFKKDYREKQVTDTKAADSEIVANICENTQQRWEEDNSNTCNDDSEEAEDQTRFLMPSSVDQTRFLMPSSVDLMRSIDIIGNFMEMNGISSQTTFETITKKVQEYVSSPKKQTVLTQFFKRK